MAISRPEAGGEVALDDDNLARIGLAVVYEAAAKTVAASALRALCTLDEAEWIKLGKVQFKQILARISKRVEEIDDEELSSRFATLEAAVTDHQEVRNMIVHVLWGAGGRDFIGYDYTRRRELTEADIIQAVEGCAEIKRAASWFTMRVANLIEERVLPERQSGSGMTIHTGRSSVRL